MILDIDPNSSDCTEALQSAIDANIGHVGGRLLELAPGEYSIRGPLKIDRPIDFEARLHIRGLARRGVTIWQKDNDANIFEFTNAANNLRGIMLENLNLRGGKTALYLSRCTYHVYRNVTFFQTGRGDPQLTASVVLDNGSHGHTFDHCWWIHTAGDSLWVNSGTAALTGCTIGEDAGGLHTSGNLSMTGGLLHGRPRDKVFPNGLRDGMGQATFTVHGFGRLNVSGVEGIAASTFVNIDQCRSVSLSGNTIRGLSGAVVNLRRVDRDHPVVITGNAFSLDEGGEILKSHIDRRPSNWIIANNGFERPVCAPSLPEWFADPQSGNVAGPNTFRVGAL